MSSRERLPLTPQHLSPKIAPFGRRPRRCFRSRSFCRSTPAMRRGASLLRAGRRAPPPHAASHPVSQSSADSLESEPPAAAVSCVLVPPRVVNLIANAHAGAPPTVTIYQFFHGCPNGDNACRLLFCKPHVSNCTVHNTTGFCPEFHKSLHR